MFHIRYLQYKVDCFRAGQRRDYHQNWLTFTSDAEILIKVSGQHIEFSQKPFQLLVPNERQNWSSDDFETCNTEMNKLLEIGAIVPNEHEQGEFI